MAQKTQSLQVTDVFPVPCEGDNGPYTRYDVKSGNLKFVTFNDALGQKAVDAKGQTATLVYNETQVVRGNKTFTNRDLKSLLVEPGDYPVVVGQTNTGNGSQAVASHNHSSKDDQIARAVAFKGAIDLASGRVLDPDVETILGVTEAFYSYLTTGQLEPETADTRH